MKKRLIGTIGSLVAIFFLLSGVMVYSSYMFYLMSVEDVYSEGQSKLTYVASSIDNYIANSKNILWVTSDAVWDMLDHGATVKDMSEYLVIESENLKKEYDENFMGLYGVIDGEFLDGLGWNPPDDYIPMERDWYKEAIKAQGETIVLSPYVDAYTGDIVITICRMLPDGKSVMAIDMSLNRLKNIVSSAQMKEGSTNMVLDDTGLIIAHDNGALEYKNVNDVYTMPNDFIAKLHQYDESYFEATIDGKDYIVLTDTIVEDWHMIILANKVNLFSNTWRELMLNVLIYIVIYLAILGTSIFSFINEGKYYKQIIALKEAESQKEYESELLKIEKESAEASNKAKGDFLALMSHEIRTPINAIIGMNEMVIREAKEENIQGYASHIKYSGNVLLGLVNTILDFSKIEEGKMEIIPVKYSIAPVLQQLIFALKPRMKDDVEFIVDVDEKIPCELVGDYVRVSQVIMNLSTNAIKYTSEGSITLTVKEVGRSLSTVDIYVSVKDTGKGIKTEDQEKLFESFRRLDEAEHRDIEGTGLGMTIVSRLLEMMDSKIHVESEYNKGSDFSFVIRQGIANAEPMGKFEFSENPSDKVFTEDPLQDVVYAPKASILVVDDNEMNRLVATNLMKQNGIVPDLAESGFQAIEMIKEMKYNIVFLDHRMPKMDGVETLAKMKEENIIPEGTVIIALTANAIAGSKEKYLEYGFNDYLSKPIDAKELEAILKKYIPKELQENKKDGAAGKTTASNAGAAKAKKLDADIIEHDAPARDFDDPSELIEHIRQIGIGVGAGLYYCNRDEQFYLNLLCDYADSYDKKRHDLTELVDKHDWNEYGVLVHAIKSSSKTVGADDLYNMAKKLEEAAKNSDETVIMAEHSKMMEEYKDIAEKIKKVLNA